MTIELDHVFVCTAVGATEADRLVASGLTEGTLNSHPGEGNANRRFFFCDAICSSCCGFMTSAKREVRSSLPRGSGIGDNTASPGTRLSVSLPPEHTICYNATSVTIRDVGVPATLSAA